MWTTRTDTSEPPKQYRMFTRNGRDIMLLVNHNGKFNATAQDGERLLTPEIEKELEKRGWDYFMDGHGGIYASINAPEESQDELEEILSSRS
jgi:hypothetical protein